MSFLCQQHRSEMVDLDGTEVLEVCALFFGPSVHSVPNSHTVNGC